MHTEVPAAPLDPLQGSEIPLQSLVRTMVMQVVPLHATEAYARADIHTAAHGSLHSSAEGGALWEVAICGRPHSGAWH